MKEVYAPAMRWINANLEKVSLLGSSDEQSVWVGADTPRVLASTQKIHHLAAFAERYRSDPSLVGVQVERPALLKHYLPGTDRGAYSVAMLADGFDPFDPTGPPVPLPRLLTHTLYYSSNAAADAVADCLAGSLAKEISPNLTVEAPLTQTLPPRLSRQLPAAYMREGRLTGPRSESTVHMGWSTYLGPVSYLVDLAKFIVQHRRVTDGKDLVRLVPRVSQTADYTLRLKRGELPGHRGGIGIKEYRDGRIEYAAYAVSELPYRSEEAAFVRSIEEASLMIALGELSPPAGANDEERA